MVRATKFGKVSRMDFSRSGEVLQMPNLIEIQIKSYQWFLEEGLLDVFHDISPITDYTGNLMLEFTDYQLDREHPKYEVDECKERDATYAAPLKAKVRLINRETGEVKEQEIFMGDFPLMTNTGTFVINGAERVIVSQLVRSPGIYYSMKSDRMGGKKLFSATVIPNRGAWLEYETDSNDVLSVRIDRTRKIHLTVLLRALGYGTDNEIINLLGEDERLLRTLEKDGAKSVDEGLVEIYKRLRPGEPPTVDSARALIDSLFFDPKRYDTAKFGRYKFNKKLSVAARVSGRVAAEQIIDPATGEVLAEKGAPIARESAEQIQDAGINVVNLIVDGKYVRVIGNNMVSLNAYVPEKVQGIPTTDKVRAGVLAEILQQHESQDDIAKAVRERYSELVPKHITEDDIIASISYLVNLNYGVGTTDDIDHLGNRRLRSVGELLQNQFRIGLARMERVVRERMTIQDIDIVTPQALINIKPVTSAIKEFFGSSQLSQFMGQTNPLDELTHKRRLSALGPGGLSRERATFEVRDVHYSHYGRMCPIETPEGPNIGLIGSLSTYARVNEYGFIEAPYCKVDKSTGAVTGNIEYLSADKEDSFIIAQANEPLDADGRFINKRVVIRYYDEILEVENDRVDYMDVSPKMLVSVATAMIPFLENDDANRALMGSNMQRQAVPLIKPESPIVATGIEHRAAIDSGVCMLARIDGAVERVSASEVVVKGKGNRREAHKLQKYMRSNQGTCINQRPVVRKGDAVAKGDVIADGPSTDNGEISLGRNVLIGFMTWEGYNYEDAILISEKLVREDVFTSIHIEEYEAESRDTKLGPEEITRDIPNVSEDVLKDLDERGIIRIGAEVRSGDILVGKVTPKGETELTAEERLLRAIFGEKAREVRDTSLRVPHGEAGIIVDVKVFTREQGDDLSPGVNELVRVYIAQKRKISVGDKMAGRHGNKGVISRILPEEDMPFLPDGTPLEIVLNPMGVPSRMNLGQVLEVHLGYAAKALGWKVASPVFAGATETRIIETLQQAGLEPDGKTVLYDGRTGEAFDNRVTVGYMYMLKLAHLVDDKIHARSTGPYSLVTQQPLGGKAQFGGQRFGEMEVWALEAYGASYTLQEILTVKSDDIVGRVKTYEAIVKGENVPEPGIPESFKVLIKELQSLALDVKVYSDDREEVSIKENLEDEAEDLDVNIEGTEDGGRYVDYAKPKAAAAAAAGAGAGADASDEMIDVDSVFEDEEEEEEDEDTFDRALLPDAQAADELGGDDEDDDDGGDALSFGSSFVDDDEGDGDADASGLDEEGAGRQRPGAIGKAGRDGGGGKPDVDMAAAEAKDGSGKDMPTATATATATAGPSAAGEAGGAPEAVEPPDVPQAAEAEPAAPKKPESKRKPRARAKAKAGTSAAAKKKPSGKDGAQQGEADQAASKQQADGALTTDGEALPPDGALSPDSAQAQDGALPTDGAQTQDGTLPTDGEASPGEDERAKQAEQAAGEPKTDGAQAQDGALPTDGEASPGEDERAKQAEQAAGEPKTDGAQAQDSALPQDGAQAQDRALPQTDGSPTPDGEALPGEDERAKQAEQAAGEPKTDGSQAQDGAQPPDGAPTTDGEASPGEDERAKQDEQAAGEPKTDDAQAQDGALPTDGVPPPDGAPSPDGAPPPDGAPRPATETKKPKSMKAKTATRKTPSRIKVTE